jgi:protocatechuate 3,4-dioxygenase beta subunit
MDNDDRSVGRILGRREVLALLGATGGAAWLAHRRVLGALALPATASAGAASTLGASTPVFAQDMPSCIVRPELTEGPYFVDQQLERSDIRSEPSDGSMRDGTPFVVTFNVSQVGSDSCTPLPGARVDVWHCDALGVYSGVTDNSFPGSTVGQKFLRGCQTTDDNGMVQFTTIYPGWYAGRAVHVHFKIRTTGSDGASYEFTSQFFLDESVTDQVHSQMPYAAKGQNRLRNEADGIYRSGGSQLLLVPQSTDVGYSANLPIGLDLSDTAVGTADGNGGFGTPGGPGGRGGRPAGLGGPGGPARPGFPPPAGTAP